MAQELSGKKATNEIKGAQDASKEASTDAGKKKGMGDYENTVSK